jgi:cbb3-type cytochrome oxidase maturation protein
MDVIYGLIPSMLVVGLLAVVIIIWAAKSGQYDDMDGEAYRILNDEDEQPAPQRDTFASKQAPQTTDLSSESIKHKD